MPAIPFNCVLARLSGFLSTWPRMVAIILALLVASCATVDKPLVWLQGPDQAIPEDATTFTTRVRPVPGQADNLDLVEREVIAQMRGLGYEEVDRNADLTISIELRPTGQITDLIEPVESGQFLLRMSSGERLLRFGETPNYSETELDILSRERVGDIVSEFLRDMPSR